MDLTDTWLWRRAFIEVRGDASTEEQEFFKRQLIEMRKRVVPVVEKIASDLPGMTVHDVSHLDALWQMASILTKDRIELNPPEAFVFGAAVLLHDAAMTLKAYSGGIKELETTVEWKDSYARLMAKEEDSNIEERPGQSVNLKAEATTDALRKLHAVQAERLPFISWGGSSNEPEFLIDDAKVRNFYGQRIGLIAHSHWWPIEKVVEDLDDLGPLSDETQNSISCLKLACLLRAADAIHLDSRRAPSFLRKLVEPTGESARHWEFQNRMAAPFIEGEELIFTVSSPFEIEHAQSWWLAYDAISMVDQELRDVDRVFAKYKFSSLNARRARGASSPLDLAEQIKTSGWVPVDTRLRVSDVPRIVETLGGSKLYGEEPSAALRELIQNATDAVMARRALEARGDAWGEVKVCLEKRGEDTWLSVEDNGVGMSELVLAGPLMDFGSSFWRSELAAQEFPGLQSKKSPSVGKYGIGFFAVFMLGSHVRVVSRRFDKDHSSAKVLEFSDGLNLRPLLRSPKSETVPIDGGTRVEVKIDAKSVQKAEKSQPDLFLYDFDPISKSRFIDCVWGEMPLDGLVGAIAPTSRVSLLTKKFEFGTQTTVVANDWQSIPDTSLQARIVGDASLVDGGKVEKGSRLSSLFDGGSEAVGRLKLAPYDYSYKFGCITVGGFRANGLSGFAGVVDGKETTASRQTAIASLSKSEWMNWADEQASLISVSEMSDEAKAECALTVLWLGGDPKELPIARLNGAWLSCKELAQAIESESHIFIYDEEITYDEDWDDDVSEKKFNEDFEESNKIIFLCQRPHHRVVESLSLLGFPERAVSPRQVFDEQVRMLWNKEPMDDYREEEIGTVDGFSIFRTVDCYQRS